MQKQFYLNSTVEQSSHCEEAMQLFLVLCAFSFIYEAKAGMCTLMYIFLCAISDIIFIYCTVIFHKVPQ